METGPEHDRSPAPAAPPSGGGRRRLTLIAGVVALAVVVVVGAVIAQTRSDPKSSVANTVPTTVSGTSSPEAPGATSVPGASSGSGGSTTAGPGLGTTVVPPASATTTAGPITTTTEPPVAAITDFSGALTQDCTAPVAPGSVPHDNPAIILRWAASGGVIDISVDGPGIYQADIGSTGSRTLPFSCPGPHIYTLIAHGRHGTTATKSITVTSHSTTKCHPGGEACPP